MKRLLPADRKALLLEAALLTAQAKGYRRMTRDDISQRAGTSPSLVSLYLGAMPALRQSVMREAVKREIVAIVAEGLAERDPRAMKASDALKRKAAAELTR
jgi:AcrR family transcriptional regulator